MKSQDSDVKYCVVAFIDLQGFSSHLEVSRDIRTKIGKEAINRLENLEKAIKFMVKEQQRSSVHFAYKRINDSIILSIDLNDVLMPYIGDTYKAGMPSEDWDKYYDGDKEGGLKENYSRKRKEYTSPLVKFLGIVARMHQIINREEWKNNFAGAKTIISTGFRRKFVGLDGKEDYFSANFAFSNAYKAQDLLKGKWFCLDNNILQMLDADLHTKNIAKYCCITFDSKIYSPLVSEEITNTIKWRESSVTEVDLFRKKYYFREILPSPLTYLQFIDNVNSRRDIYKKVKENIMELNIEAKIESGENFMIFKLPYDLAKEVDKIDRRNRKSFNYISLI